MLPEIPEIRLARRDPYRRYRVRLSWRGRRVAGLSAAELGKRSTEVVVGRRLPGQTGYEAVTLSGGVTHDRAFHTWAGSAQGPPRDLVVEIANEAGQVTLRYTLSGCRVSQYEALPDLDAGTGSVIIRSIRLENRGWERDAQVGEPTEPFVDDQLP